MKISVLSGKGGAGKTTVAVSLSLFLKDVTYVDMDAEEPNGHLFHHPVINEEILFTRTVPQINTDLCTFCGKCQQACKFNAIVVIPTLYKVMVHDDLCHHCGACFYACPVEGALIEVQKRIGTIRKGVSGLDEKIGFIEARLDTGQSSTSPLLSGLNEELDTQTDYILDAPPGTSCSVVEVLDQTDFVVLVTEPTPFGLSDLELSLQLVREMGKPHALIINKQDEGNDLVQDFAQKHDIEVLGAIPFDRDIALHYADGTLFTTMPDAMSAALNRIVAKLEGRITSLEKTNG